MEAKNLIRGFIAGAALGVAAGLLLAPASGDKTRKKLAKNSMKMKDGVVDYVESSINGLRNQFNAKLDQVTGRAKEVADQATGRAKDAAKDVSDRIANGAEKAKSYG